jgi:hypothetical protein
VAVRPLRRQAAFVLKVEPVDDARACGALLGQVGAHLRERAVGVGRSALAHVSGATGAFGGPAGTLASRRAQRLMGEAAGVEEVFAAPGKGGSAGAVLGVGELVGFAAGHREDEDLRRAAVTGAHEGKAVAARVPGGAVRALFAEGELLRGRAPAGVYAVQVRAVGRPAGAVGPLDDALDGVDDAAPARRDGHVFELANLEQVGRPDGRSAVRRLLGRLPGGRRDEQERQQQGRQQQRAAKGHRGR